MNNALDIDNIALLIGRLQLENLGLLKLLEQAQAEIASLKEEK